METYYITTNLKLFPIFLFAPNDILISERKQRKLTERTAYERRTIMFDKSKVKLGIAPIAWTNDDLPDLGRRIPLNSA